ncbi:MAG: hypothetical protein JSV39_03730 [Candidatus Aenigmatarchaeota archaeon]|nr:MAG: hypothetical protein JSV39_03730 [Candidatus Aenigmarchaeota archaeon]
MGSKKGQLFLIAIVFLIGLIFVIQQALFQYTSIEMSEPFEERGAEIFGNIIEVVNKTIRETHSCNETKDSFENNMEEIKISFLKEHGKAYSIEISYDLDCSKWNNAPPNPGPLKITLSVTGMNKDTRGTYEFYH